MQRFDRRTDLVIAVDGPAGSGKSTAARRVATALNLRYLDTGAMYRALTWWMLDHGVPVADPAAVLAHLGQQQITVGTDPLSPQILLDGTDVADPIRSREVSNAVSQVAAIPQVRELLVAKQQQIIADALAAGMGIVADGRDIGTVVAPEAAVKVYLTASERIRAERRAAELAADQAASVASTEREQARRDRLDAAQMIMAEDAVEIDTTQLSLDAVVDRIVAMAAKRAVRNG
jgi:CMP/dCMP kinase